MVYPTSLPYQAGPSGKPRHGATMSRQNLTPVAQTKLLAVVEKLGMTIKTNKGWLKVYPSNGCLKKSLGIPTTKTVTRVELVGFEHELAVSHPKPPASTVTQMIDFAQDEKLVLRAFYKTCKHLVDMANKSKEVTSTPASSPEVKQEEAPVEQSVEQPVEEVLATA